MDINMNNLDYRAVEILSNDCQCQLSKHSGETILLGEFNKLVHQIGARQNCTCQFKHYDDRRHRADRRKLDIDNLFLNAYRRTQPFGRRVADKIKKMQFEQMFDQIQFIS
jgi:hypothetical protein